MAKINRLDSSIYNRIAAGEVVDRPYSVVKEFVENSLDAGAKNISVEIERGGKDLIRVSDDGEGIEYDDLVSAFYPHATSKIGKAEDLECIRTLGFRGEALASIAAVSKVCLRSRHRGAEQAFEIACNGSELTDIQPCAFAQGTEITAETLFYNTPVRLKFLKTDKGEESEITNFVARFILGNPHVAFHYTADGKSLLRSFGGGEDEAIAAVYGAGILSSCYKIDATRHGIRLRGFIGRPEFSKPNRTYQSVFINGRYVVNNTVASAISNAYGGYLMKRQYPFYVLFLDIPAEAVDVNVHPNKADVRFENNQVVYGAVYTVVSSVLDGNANALEFIVSDLRASASPSQDVRKQFVQSTFSDLQKEQPTQGQAPAHASDRSKGDASRFAAKAVPAAAQFSAARGAVPARDSDAFTEKISGVADARTEIKGWQPQPRRGVLEFHDSASDGVSAADDIFAENKRYLDSIVQKTQQKFSVENAEYRGTLFNTYLMYEEGDAVYLIDQHAAHERLIFDKLRKEMDARTVMRQPMLVPYVLNLNGEEAAFLAEHLNTLREIGFEIEEFGIGSYKVSSVPVDLQDIDLSAFFDEVLKEVGSLKGIRLREILRDKLAMAACKHAVKGGMLLTDSEKNKLFSMLRGDMGMKCPHGRPIAVRMTKTEIEKLFKRIV